MRKKYFLILVIVFCIQVTSIAQQSVQGTVKDIHKSPLPGVSIIIEGTSIGASTDFDGNFNFNTSKTFPFKLKISFLGFKSKIIEINSTDSQTIVLEESLELMDVVVLTASRKAEKRIDAPASVSIISSRKLLAKPVDNPIKALTGLVGVEVSEENAGQYSVTLRGGRYPFGNETLVMVDNRNVKLAGFDLADIGRLPMISEDIHQIEVVRGPASAMYGPGVTSGVVHFLTKSPIDYPGTTITMGVGTNATLTTGIKHAMKFSDKFGIKVSAKYYSANAWEYDPKDPIDAHIFNNKTAIVNGLTGEVLKTVEKPLTAVKNIGVSTSMEYRSNGHTLKFNAGFTKGKAPFYVDRGDGYWKYPSLYTQVRYSVRGFFAQYSSSYLKVGLGDAFSYKTGEINVAENAAHEFQTQYNFDAIKNRLNISIGGEYRLELTDSKGTVYGRYEDEDDFGVLGLYLHGDLVLVPEKLNLKVTGRIDDFKAMNATEFSPQVALIYKPAPNHSIRGSWSRTAQARASIDFFGDVIVGTPSASQPFYINYLGGYSNYNYDNARTETFIPGVSFDGTDMPLSTAYQIAIGGLLGEGAINQGQYDALIGLKDYVQGTSAATLINPLTGTVYDAGVNPMATKTTPIKPKVTENFEFGYQGIINDKWILDFSSYWGRKIKGDIQLTNPGVHYGSVGQDLIAAVNPLISDDQLTAFGIDRATLHYMLSEAMKPIENEAIIGFVEHSMANKYDGVAEMHLTYENTTFNEAIKWGGLEVGAQYLVTDKWSVYANYTHVNFDFSKTKLVNSGLTPKNRVKYGIDYTQEKGISCGVSARYQDSYTANFKDGYGFQGIMPSFTVVDANVSYKFENGWRLAGSIQNINNTSYRAYPFTPKIGRMLMLNASYSF